jgi:hypothetical protein
MRADSLLALREAIAQQFPTEAARANERLEQCGFGADAHIIWLEEFCRSTTNSVAALDGAVVTAHLAFMANQLARGDAEVRSAIDVAYVEPLLHGLKGDRKRWALALMPPNIKQLYVQMWGELRF